jgi:type II secretory pathway component PulM
MQKRFAQQISQQQLAVAGIVAALFFVALFAFVLIPALAPDTSAVTLTCLEDEEGDCLRLPQVTGINLDGAEFAFPDDFSTPYTLVVMPFDQEQQEAALAWVPLFRELADDEADLAYFNLAALPDLAPAVRLLVQTGMSLAVDDEAVRDVTTISYLQDQATFISALNVADTEAMQVFLFNAEGDVLWQERGAYDEDLAEDLRQAVSDALASEAE